MKHIGNLIKPQGATHRKKRVGRGEGSGYGGTSGKGHKGQKSRSGATIRIGFEGGQMPINRRVPKFGFHNKYSVKYSVINLGQIQQLIDDNKVDANNIDKLSLIAVGAITNKKLPLKVLGDGAMNVATNITADKFSSTAKEKIEKAGGAVNLNG
ncbi:50S ribosomal protein L15 [bacterium]|nr:MAG: 50S ribosomal protein L15 [bacterium]